MTLSTMPRFLTSSLTSQLFSAPSDMDLEAFGSCLRVLYSNLWASRYSISERSTSFLVDCRVGRGMNCSFD